MAAAPRFTPESLRTPPAADCLRFRQVLGRRDLPAAFVLSPRFYLTVLRVFRTLVPLVRFLNEPPLASRRPAASADPRP